MSVQSIAELQDLLRATRSLDAAQGKSHGTMSADTRVTLGNFPTRMTRSAELGALLGVDLWLKHEFEADGFGSGNKVRKLEFMIPEIVRRGYSGIIGDGTTQSNCAMALAVYAPRFGLSVDLILNGPQTRHGNYLDVLRSGATVTLLNEWSPGALLRVRRQIQEAADSDNRQLYIVPTGATNETTVLAGVDLAAEMVQQERAGGLSFDYVILPTASGGTQAGLELGRLIYGRPWKIIAIGVANDATFFADVVERLARASFWGQVVEDFGHELRSRVHMGALGGGYGIPLPGTFEEIKFLRMTYGLVLDSVYTYKAYIGLRQLIESGEIRTGSSVAFIHTGGLNERFVDFEDLS